MKLNQNKSNIYIFLSREHDHDVRDIGNTIFVSVLLHPMLSYANLTKLFILEEQSHIGQKQL